MEGIRNDWDADVAGRLKVVPVLGGPYAWGGGGPYSGVGGAGEVVGTPYSM